MCSICSFWYVLINSFYAFLSFWALAFVGFLYLHRDAVFMFFCFSLTVNVFQGTLCLAFTSVGMHSAAVSKWTGRSSHIRHLK